MRSWAVGVVATLGVIAAVGCSEETPPPPAPKFVAGSARLDCALDAEDRSVLTGGEVQVVAQGLLSVTAQLPGVGEIALVAQGEAVAEQPQTWRFAYEQDRRLLCEAQLVATFEALDERGERTKVSVSAP